MDCNEFYLGETVPMAVEARDYKTGDLVDTTSMKITISGTEVIVDDEEMTKDSTGCYHYDWESDTLGTINIRYKAVYNGKTVISKAEVNIIP
jgi:hypothetical protein